MAFTFFEFGQIDWQNVGFWHQKLEISGFCDSVCVFRNSLSCIHGFEMVTLPTRSDEGCQETSVERTGRFNMDLGRISKTTREYSLDLTKKTRINGCDKIFLRVCRYIY